MAVKLTRSRRRATCPVCGVADCLCTGDVPYSGKGEKAIVIRIPDMMSGTARASHVVAPERIYENGRLLYAKGQPVKIEDVERLGLGTVRASAKPKAATPATPKTPADDSSKTLPTRKPRAARTTKPRGHRARPKAPVKPPEEDTDAES